MKILHLSDLHFETNDKGMYPKLNEHMNHLSDQIKESDTDFMVITGDLSNDGSTNRTSLEKAKEWIESIAIPYIAIPGNHDLGANKWRSEMDPELEYYEDTELSLTNYGKTFKQEPILHKEFEHIHLIAIVLRENDPENVLPSLEAMLDETTKPVILCGHYPLVKTRDIGYLNTSSFHDDFIPTTGLNLQKIIENNDQIKVYLCGHVHVNSVRKLTNSCLQVTAGALGPGPSIYRSYTISDQGICYETLLGAGPLQFWFDERAANTDVFDYNLGTMNERFGKIKW